MLPLTQQKHNTGKSEGWTEKVMTSLHGQDLFYEHKFEQYK